MHPTVEEKNPQAARQPGFVRLRAAALLLVLVLAGQGVLPAIHCQLMRDGAAVLAAVPAADPEPGLHAQGHSRGLLSGQGGQVCAVCASHLQLENTATPQVVRPASWLHRILPPALAAWHPRILNLGSSAPRSPPLAA